MMQVEKHESELTARGKRTRDALLRAAEEVFGRVGFERASVVDITQTAGVAQGTLYLYFKDKRSMFLILVEALGRSLRAHLADAIKEQPNRIAAERAGMRAFFEFCREHKNLYRIVRQAEFVDEEVYRDYYRTLASGYERGLEAAMGRGEIRRANAEHLAYALMGIADFLGMRWILWEEDADFDALVDSTMGLLEHGIALAD